MGIYGPEYPHFQYCIERATKPSRRIFDVFRHTVPVLDSVRKGDKILDLGSGIGENGHDLKFLGVSTVSMDLSIYAQQKGIEVFGKEAANNRVVGNALHLPFPDKSFDMAISWDLFEHLYPNQNACILHELDRVTKRNRLFIKLTPTEDAINIDNDTTHIIKWSEKEWKQWFENNGWNTLKNPTRNLFGRITHGNFLLKKI